MAKKKSRDNILIDNDLYQSVLHLDDAKLGKVVRAVMEFGFERKEPQHLDEALKAIYTFATLKMVKAQNRYDNCIRNGRNGGAPQGNKNALKNKTTKKQPKNNQETTKIQPENNQNFLKNNQSLLIETEKESEKETEFPNDKKTKNIFSLSDASGHCAIEHSEQEREVYRSEYYSQQPDKYRRAMDEIADIILDLREFVQDKEAITYNGVSYDTETVLSAIEKRGKAVTKRLAYYIANGQVENNAMYVLGVLLTGSNELED